MKTSLALIVAATSVFVFTQAADAQCGCQQTVSYYAPTTTYYAPTTTYYAPTTAYYAPTTTYYAPTTAYYAPTTTYYAPTDCLLSNFGVLRPNHGILRRQWLGNYGSGYYGGYNRGGLFGTGVGGWAGVRGINRRWDRRGW